MNEFSTNYRGIENHPVQISKTDSKILKNHPTSNPDVLPSKKDVIFNPTGQIYDGNKSHPYTLSTSANSESVPTQTVDLDIVANSHPNEKPDTISSTKRPNVYKPRLNRPTRYPIPLKNDISRRSIKFQTRQQSNQLERLKISPSPTDSHNLQRNIVDKSVLKDRLKPTIELPTTISNFKPSVGFRKLHSPNSIVSASRTKVQSRIFVPENMDFSQLSDVDMENKQKRTSTNNPDSCSKVICKRVEDISVSRCLDNTDLFTHSERIVKIPAVSNSVNTSLTNPSIDPQPKSKPNFNYTESQLVNNIFSLEDSVEKNTPIQCVSSQLPINPHNETQNTHKDNSFASVTDVETAVPLNKPLSLAKNDLQIWIKNTIDIKDSITAAYLISSHIFEKTYQSISQRHAIERRELEINYDSNIKMLMEKHDTLQKQYSILYFTNPTSNFQRCNKGSKIQRVVSLPINLAVHDSPLDLVTTISNCEAFSKLTTNPSLSGDVSVAPEICRSYPSPPPDLPEVVFKMIPLPPPNLPSVLNLGVMNSFECSPDLLDLQATIFPKPKSRKQSIMKPLHWKRLCLPGRKNKQEVIWKILPKSKIKSSELFLFEQLFSTQKPKKSFRPMIAVNLRSTLPQEILPLDISKQIGVIFKNIESVNIPLEEIAEILYTGDIKSTHLTTSILENLCKLVTDEWINVVKSYVHKNPTAELSKESKILRFFCDIPNVNMRFQNLLYMENFEEEIRHIHRNIDIISNCCSKLKNSNELRILFSIILLLGNYMNQTYDSFKEAIGFNLELLPRLKETKTSDNSSTFLDFVSRCYLLTFEHSIHHGSINNILPFPDTGDLFVASKITLKDCRE